MDAIMFKNDIKIAYNVAYKLTQNRSESEDLAQETLIIAWQKASDLKYSEARISWLKKICLNLFYMKNRKRKIIRSLL